MKSSAGLLILAAMMVAAAPGAAQQSPRTPAAAVAPRARPVVVIDAGHGGSNPGARGAVPGLYEKQVTLAMATQIAAALRAGGVEVYLTRTGDVTMTLRQRMAIANQRAADLFISVHANASAARTQRGYETFVLTPGGVDVDGRALRSQTGTPRLGVPDDVALVLDDVERGAAQWEAADLAVPRCRPSCAACAGPTDDRGVRAPTRALGARPSSPPPSPLVRAAARLAPRSPPDRPLTGGALIGADDARRSPLVAGDRLRVGSGRCDVLVRGPRAGRAAAPGAPRGRDRHRHRVAAAAVALSCGHVDPSRARPRVRAVPRRRGHDAGGVPSSLPLPSSTRKSVPLVARDAVSSSSANPSRRPAGLAPPPSDARGAGARDVRGGLRPAVHPLAALGLPPRRCASPGPPCAHLPARGRQEGDHQLRRGRPGVAVVVEDGQRERGGDRADRRAARHVQRELDRLDRSGEGVVDHLHHAGPGALAGPERQRSARLAWSTTRPLHRRPRPTRRPRRRVLRRSRPASPVCSQIDLDAYWEADRDRVRRGGRVGVDARRGRGRRVGGRGRRRRGRSLQAPLGRARLQRDQPGSAAPTMISVAGRVGRVAFIKRRLRSKMRHEPMWGKRGSARPASAMRHPARMSSAPRSRRARCASASPPSRWRRAAIRRGRRPRPSTMPAARCAKVREDSGSASTGCSLATSSWRARR